MVRQIIVILGDQLSPDNPALRSADPSQDIVFMAEVGGEATYVRHHPQKIALILSAMRHFAQELRENGWTVHYTTLDDPENHQTLGAEIIKIAAQHKCTKITLTEPSEWRVIDDMTALPLDVTMLPDDRFFASHGVFETWAEGRKALRMEYFYREMRKSTGYLMEDGKPTGGQWNYDHDNRKAAPKDVTHPGPIPFTPDQITRDVIAVVQARFDNHFGTLQHFEYAVTRADALHALDHFIAHALPRFGDYQDACCAIIDTSITLSYPPTSILACFPRKRSVTPPNKRSKTVMPRSMRLRGSSAKSWAGANLCEGFIS